MFLQRVKTNPKKIFLQETLKIYIFFVCVTNFKFRSKFLSTYLRQSTLNFFSTSIVTKLEGSSITRPTTAFTLFFNVRNFISAKSTVLSNLSSNVILSSDGSSDSDSISSTAATIILVMGCVIAASIAGIIAGFPVKRKKPRQII